jgi:hypothetical protein
MTKTPDAWACRPAIVGGASVRRGHAPRLRDSARPCSAFKVSKITQGRNEPRGTAKCANLKVIYGHTQRTPLPPAALSDSQSAAYCGVALNSYRKMRAQGLMPRPRLFGSGHINLRAELDAALAALPTAPKQREEG